METVLRRRRDAAFKLKKLSQGASPVCLYSPGEPGVAPKMFPKSNKPPATNPIWLSSKRKQSNLHSFSSAPPTPPQFFGEIMNLVNSSFVLEIHIMLSTQSAFFSHFALCYKYTFNYQCWPAAPIALSFQLPPPAPPCASGLFQLIHSRSHRLYMRKRPFQHIFQQDGTGQEAPHLPQREARGRECHCQ